MKMSTSRIHNVRFYNLEPRAIFCLCYEAKTQKLAVSRSDNSIEIWNTKNALFLENTILNEDDEGSIEAMIWINDERLISTGLRGMITEYDLNKLTKKYETSVTGGVTWCLDINPKRNRIAVGTEDGYINTFSITDESLIYERIFDKQNGRILCLKWDNTGEMIFTGSLDTIRVWNSISGHVIHKMTTIRKKIKRETIVWCLAVTNDNFIVSGDSQGILSIWDPNIGILIESHESSTADILSIAISNEFNTIYCAGVDPTIRSFSKLIKSNVLTNDKTTPKWVKGMDRKIHIHDVRALIETNGKLYSGGVDAYIAQSSYPPKVLAKYPPLLQNNKNVILCKESRCILLRYPNYIELWKLGKSTKDLNEGVYYTLQDKPMKLLQLKTKNEENILSFAVNTTANLIVYSTSTQFKIFQFDIVDNEGQLMKQEINQEDYCNVQKMMFTPDNKLLIAVKYNEDNTNTIILFQNQNNFLQFYDSFQTDCEKIKNIRLICSSSDSKYLVCSDNYGNIVVHPLDQEFSSELSCWYLPKYTCPATAIQANNQILIIIYVDHKIVEYNLANRQFTKFSDKLQKNMPRDWLTSLFPITNITFDPNKPSVIIAHDDSTIYIIDKNKKMSFEKSPKVKKCITGDDDSSSGSVANQQQKQHFFQIIKKYKHLVHLEWLDDNELVAVEINPITLMEKLPPTLKRKCFGM